MKEKISSQGYISLHRQIQEHWLWFSEPFTKSQAWIDLLLLASHKGNTFFIRGNKIDLEEGEVAYSKESLASRWKWSRNKVLRFLKLLETEQQIEQQKTASIIVLRIINYKKFQQTEQQKDNRKTTERQQKDINNNVNNDNNDNNEYIGEFEEFWIEYGKIGNKQKAFIKFQNLRRKLTYEEILNHHTRYEQYCKSEQWYAKQHCATWLNGNYANEWKTTNTTKKSMSDRQRFLERQGLV